MRKNFGKNTWLYPMPVLIIGTFNEDGTPNVMNAAWGGIYDTNKIMVCLGEHKTTDNIRNKKAFTINIANAKNVVGCDYVGIVSGNKVINKFEKAGFTYTKSELVDAPIINELPVCLECSLEKVIEEDGVYVGNILNVNAQEEVLGEDGKIDYKKVEPITYEPVHHYYVKLGDKVGNAFSDGNKIK